MPFAEENVRWALDRGEFVPYFQPLVDLRTGSIHGFEILARWNHPEKGLVAPSRFIPLVESYGLINELSATLLRQSFAAARKLRSDFGLSVNFSPAQLHDRTLPGILFHMAREADFDLSRLTVELTETALVDDLELAGAVAAEFKELGVQLALDDFGTGYSSLLHLQTLPFDELKVDLSFVRSMVESRQSRKITGAVVGLGLSLGLRTVAEGVEEQAQADLLTRQGCALGQGLLYGDAVPAEGLAAKLSQRYPVVGETSVSSIETPASITEAPRALDAHPIEPVSQLRAIYDGAPVGLAFLDCDLRFINLNQRMAQMNRISVQDHLGRKIADVLPEIYPQFGAYLERALAGESIPNIEIRRPAASADELPTTMLATYEPVRDEAGEILGVSASIVDISVVTQQDMERLDEHKRAIEELRRSEQRLRAIFDAAPVGIVLAESPSGKVLNANPRAQELLGFHFTPDMVWSDEPWEAFDLTGQPIKHFDLPLSRALHRAETAEAQEVLLLRPDGYAVCVSATAAPVRFENGDLLGGVLVIQDIETAMNERERLTELTAELTKIVSSAAYPSRAQAA